MRNYLRMQLGGICQGNAISKVWPTCRSRRWANWLDASFGPSHPRVLRRKFCPPRPPAPPCQSSQSSSCEGRRQEQSQSSSCTEGRLQEQRQSSSCTEEGRLQEESQSSSCTEEGRLQEESQSSSCRLSEQSFEEASCIQSRRLQEARSIQAVNVVNGVEDPRTLRMVSLEWKKRRCWHLPWSGCNR